MLLPIMLVALISRALKSAAVASRTHGRTSDKQHRLPFFLVDALAQALPF